MRRLALALTLALTIAGLGSVGSVGSAASAGTGTPSSLLLLLSWMPSAITLGLTAAAAVAAPTPGPAPPPSPPSPPPPVVPRQIYQFTDGNNIENVLVQRDGTLLLTTLNSGDLLALDPASPHPAPQAVVHLNGSTGLSGLAPLSLSAPDGDGDGDGDGDDYMLYAVSAGVHTPFHLEDVAVYVVALPNPNAVKGRGEGEGEGKGKQPSSRTISLSAGVVRDRISVNGTLNGMAALPDCPETVLCADSLGHRVFRVNTRTRAVDIAIDDSMLGPGSNTAFPVGINGLRIYKGYMYYTNSGQGFFARVKIDSYGNQAGPFEVLARIPRQGPASPSNAYDDFTFDAHGNAYLSYHSFAFTKVTPSGQQTTFVGGGSNYTTVIEPSSAATSPDGKTIYLVTGGATVNGVVEGGQVLEAMIP